jgi:hypothetical protein
MGNKPLYEIKKEIDALYADYDDKNADRLDTDNIVTKF